MIIIIGTFPPPVHGMSSINEMLYNQLTASGFEVQKINTSPPTLRRNPITIIRRWIPLIRGWLYIYSNLKKEDILYLAPSAGWGQIYDIVTIFLVKLKNIQKIFIHHHSFKYLNKASFVNKIFFLLTKNIATHIALCEAMGKKLNVSFRCVNIFILSNFSILLRNNINKTKKYQKPNDKFTIGYLSNITKEKGGWSIVELAKEIRKKNILAKVIVAGPCHDPVLQNALHVSQQQGLLTWLGPVFDEEKQQFFDSINVFAFPSQNEAEPLVIWEAINQRVPVISYSRGCIPDQVQKAGIILNQSDDFTSSVLERIQIWLNEPIKYQALCQETNNQYTKTKNYSDIQWNNFTKMLR